MRILGLALLFVWIVLTNHSIFSMPLAVSDTIYADIEENVLKPFFEALKNGDISNIKKFTGGDVYNNNKILLNKNKEYPNFLRKYYKNAKFQLEKAQTIEKDVIVDVIIETRDGNQHHDRWRLSKQEITSSVNVENVSWKIVETNINP